MQKYISTIIFSVIIFVVIIFTSLNYHNNEVLESRINTALKFSCDINSEKSFKEDYYILQQSHDTNVILVVFGLAVAVMGFFTYRSVVERFDYKTIELTRDFESSKDVLIKELDELKLEFFSFSADLDNERAQAFLRKKDFQNFISYTLSCVQKNHEWFQYLVKTNPDDNHSYMLSVIVDILREANDKLEPTVDVTKSSSDVSEEILIKLRRINNSEIQKLLSAIHAKFKIIPDSEYYK